MPDEPAGDTGAKTTTSTLPRHLAAAVARHLQGPTCREMRAVVAELTALRDRVETLAASRTFRREISEVYGRDAKNVVQDWQAAAWNLSTVAGILDSDVMGGAS